MKKFIIIGIVVFLLAMIVTIPASVAAKLLPSHLVANQFQGSLWNGSASSFSVNQLNLGSVEWKVKPSCFLLFQLCADINQSHHDLNSSFLLKLSSSIKIENLNASGDANILNTAVENYGITLAGDFQADLPQLSMIENRINTIEGELNFSSLSVNGVLRVVLGELTSNFEPQEKHTLIRVSNQKGHVDLAGVIQLFHDMSYELDLNIRQNQYSTDAVINGMQYIGDGRSDGSRRIQQSGQL